jgi:hypothetical protein
MLNPTKYPPKTFTSLQLTDQHISPLRLKLHQLLLFMFGM